MTVRVHSAAFTLALLAPFCQLVCANAEGLPPIATSPSPASAADAATSASNEFQLYNLAKEAAASLYSDLRSFVCKERIERFRSGPDDRAGHPIDTLTSNISFEDGAEHYTDIEQNGRRRAHFSDVSGAWSEGEFGTLIRQTRELLSSQQVSFWRYEEIDGAPAGMYTFEVPAEQSPWDLKVGSRHLLLPFRTEVWVSRATGQVLKIARTSTGELVGTGITQIYWSVTLAQETINGKQWLLPKAGQYEVTYKRADQKQWNLLSFSDYHHYETEIRIHYEDGN